MSKTKESNLYNLIKTTIKNAHFTRLESNTINGIPDLHCAYKGIAIKLMIIAAERSLL